jgi:Heparinase II/III-like protein.
MRFASSDFGDLKFILEPSRFLFVYPLVRAYAISGDERFAEAFWMSIEDWADKNPPMSGPLWICGQESSLRVLAWSFSLYGFLNSPATTSRRFSLLLSMIAAHAWRTAQTLGYARSQRSNHLITEAVGLWTVGTLFPELRDALFWKQQGNRLMREAVLDQITPQGVFLQNSFNYQRMVLQQLLWVIRLAEITDQAIDPAIIERANAGMNFLKQFVDSESGRAPNHGSNDGSYILPLSQCGYEDFRPLLRMGNCVLNSGNPLPPGPWDEIAIWMRSDAAPSTNHESKVEYSSSDGSASGYHRLGTQTSWALVRAGRYSRRPFQADQLHVDLWWRGINVACDAGTYLYNGDPPWDNGLAGSAVHNTVTVDGRDQMRRAGRFLWVDWAQASGKSFSSSSGPDDPNILDTFIGEHDGYRRVGVTHRRKVQFIAEKAWVVVDDLLGAGEHECTLHWLLPDFKFQINSASPFSARLTAGEQLLRWHIFSNSPGIPAVVRGGQNVSQKNAGEIKNELKNEKSLGWQSPTYGEINSAISLVYRVRAPLPVRIVTVICDEQEIEVRQSGARVILFCGELEVFSFSLSDL